MTLTGLAQCLFILVYMCFRVRNLRQAAVAISYFLCLACAFGLQFALRLEDFEGPIRLALWLAGALSVVICYLLVLQVMSPQTVRERKHALILISVPLTLAAAFLVSYFERSCAAAPTMICPRFLESLYWLWSMTGALCMLALISQRHVFRRAAGEKGYKERYWLVMTLIAANVMRVVVNLLQSTGNVSLDDADALHAALGIAFAYLATTTLFRVYPLPVQLNTTAGVAALSVEEQEIAARVKGLMEREKLYQEQTFSRADLARELSVSENTLSRVINIAFGKSFPRLLNEYRISDAKNLLKNHEIPIHTLAYESGFNSLASFNRVFREICGETPTQFRARHPAATKQ